MVGKLKQMLSRGDSPEKSLLLRYGAVAAVLLAGVLLLLWPAGEQETAQPDSGIAGEVFDLQVQEQQLESLLACMEGVGQVRVMLSLEKSDRQILAQEQQLRSSGSVLQPDSYQRDEAPLTLERGSGEEEVVVTQTVYPQYRGALVVCAGGNRAEVRLAVTEAVSVITGLRSDRISICAWGDS